MIRCIDEIRERVRQETGLSLTDAQIEQMLAGQPCSLADEVRSIVNKQGRLYTERLFSAVMEAGFDLHAMPLVMLGGGASFPAGLTCYGEHEPYTRQGLLEFGGCFFVCGTGRQPIQRDKTANDNYYLLTLAAIAKEIRQRGLPPECSVRIAAGLPLTSFGRDKPKFKDYLLRATSP